MLAWLGRMLSTRRQPLRVTYLSKAEPDTAWREGWLISVDSQGGCFASQPHGGEVECLPWGSIGGIRVAEDTAGAGGDADERPAFFTSERPVKG